MAKKKDSEGKITKTALKKSVLIDSSLFDTEDGELYAGGNSLKLEIGEAAGPFVHVGMKTGLVGKPKLNEKGEDVRKPVDQYSATHNGQPVSMPWSAAFTMKAKDANLKVGDVYLVRRVDNYTSSFGTAAKGYQIKVTKRAT